MTTVVTPYHDDRAGRDAISDGRRWAAAGARLARAISATFGRTGYQHTPAAGSGADAAITFLGPPFAVPGPQVLQAASSAQRALHWEADVSWRPLAALHL